MLRSMPKMISPMFCTDRATHGAGASGLSQHTQKNGVMSTGPHRGRRREETCKTSSLSQSNLF